MTAVPHVMENVDFLEVEAVLVFSTIFKGVKFMEMGERR